MKKTAAFFLAFILLTGFSIPAKAQVQSSILSTYMSVGGLPVTLQSPVTLYNDGSTVRIDMPGAYLGASDGSYLNSFLSFSFSMPSADWLLFLQ